MLACTPHHPRWPAKLASFECQIKAEILTTVAWQLRTDGVATAFFCLCVIVFIYVGYGSCASYLQSWLGEFLR